jgi:hypothetical protein
MSMMFYNYSSLFYSLSPVEGKLKDISQYYFLALDGRGLR